MIERPWWEQHPERLQRELQALDDAGVYYERDERAFDAGILKLRFELAVDGQQHRFEAVFPDLYPYFRFELAAVDVQLPYHQHPLSKYLCLMGRPTHFWNVDDTLADLLQSQLSEVFQTAHSKNLEEVIGREQAQAEPYGDFYPYVPSMFFVDGVWRIPETESSGSLEIGLGNERTQVDRLILHGAVLEVKSNARRSLLRADDAIRSMFSGTKLQARWVRADHSIAVFDPKLFFESVQAMDPGRDRNVENRCGSASIQVWGLVFPEEVGHRKRGQGWVFVARIRRRVTRSGISLAPRVSSRDVFDHFFARAGRAGPGDLKLRTPEMDPLKTKDVALFGLGCIGAPTAIELARAGIGRLRTIDDDIVDPGTVSRWPIGLAAAGRPKGEVIQEFIRTNYPGVKVTTHLRRIGVTRDVETGLESERDFIRTVIKDVSVIWDTTAEIGVHYFLSDLARSLNIPYISASGTFGGWGGLIVRITPSRTQGCWLCLQYAHSDGTIPHPPSDTNNMVQPLGCGNPTFTGAGFDLAQVALAGVRMGVSTLCEGEQDGYPGCDWDVMTIAFRDDQGNLVPPKFQTYKLGVHPSCPRCKLQAHESAVNVLASG